jgi:hypothetical protein
MERRDRTHTAILATLGACGAVVGHLVGYLISHPVTDVRHRVLNSSGHSSLESLPAVLLIVGFTVLLGQATFSTRYEGRTLRIPSTWMRLCVVQVALFAFFEVSERVAHGVAPAVWREPAVWLGLLAQIPVALLGAWLMYLTRRVARGVTARRSALPVQISSLDVPTVLTEIQFRSLAVTPIGSRAPPLPT